MDIVKSQIKGTLHGSRKAVSQNNVLPATSAKELVRFIDCSLERLDAATYRDLDTFVYDIEHVGDVMSEVSDPAPYYIAAYRLREML